MTALVVALAILTALVVGCALERWVPDAADLFPVPDDVAAWREQRANEVRDE